MPGAGATRVRTRAGHRVGLAPTLAPTLGTCSQPSSRTDGAPWSLLHNVTSAAPVAFSITIWCSVHTLVTSSGASAVTWSMGLWAAEISSRNASVFQYLLPTIASRSCSRVKVLRAVPREEAKVGIRHEGKPRGDE